MRAESWEFRQRLNVNIEWLDECIRKAQGTFAELRLRLTCTLGPPASREEIERGERAIGVAFSASHREFLWIANGLVIDYRRVLDLRDYAEHDEAFSRVGGQLQICSVADVIQLTEWHKQYADKVAAYHESSEDTWRHLTICCDCEDSNLIVLDPESCSTSGEYHALNADHEMPPGIWRSDLVIADSFEEWLRRCFASMIEKRETPDYWNSYPLLPPGAEKYDWTKINSVPKS
jgi:hypothetical protein